MMFYLYLLADIRSLLLTAILFLTSIAYLTGDWIQYSLSEKRIAQILKIESAKSRIDVSGLTPAQVLMWQSTITRFKEAKHAKPNTPLSGTGKAGRPSESEGNQSAQGLVQGYAKRDH